MRVKHGSSEKADGERFYSEVFSALRNKGGLGKGRCRLNRAQVEVPMGKSNVDTFW